MLELLQVVAQNVLSVRSVHWIKHVLIKNVMIPVLVLAEPMPCVGLTTIVPYVHVKMVLLEMHLRVVTLYHVRTSKSSLYF